MSEAPEFNFSEMKQDEFLQCLREGMQRGAAADVIGLNRRKVREFIAENDEFSNAVLDAEVDATEHVQEALYQAAISGNVAAAKTWLEMHGHARPAMPARGPSHAPPPPMGGSDPFGDLDNVAPLDPRRRRRQAE